MRIRCCCCKAASASRHCRYPTAGSEGSDEAQPFYVNSPYGIALAHNGNLINTDKLRREVFEQDLRNVNTESDSEVLLNVFAHELSLQKALTPEAVFKAIEGVNRRCIGGYAVVITVLGLGLVAFRDPHGIRPLVLGKRTGERARVPTNTPSPPNRSRSTCSVSSACATSARANASSSPRAANCSRQQTAAPQVHTPCIFEYVYFARPDSMMDNISVHKARMRMGQKLGEKILRLMPDHDIDTVIPIPDTSRDAALEIANVLGVKYREGFIKNRYVGRTFIMPGQGQRSKSVRRKLNPIPLEFRNRVVLLVDDSIVRGTTSQQIVQMARDAGARKVYLASAAPPVRFPNVYGIDMPSAEELVAHDRTEEEVAEAARLRLADLPGSCRPGRSRVRAEAAHGALRFLVLQRRIRHRHRGRLFRSHQAAALGRGEEDPSRVLTSRRLRPCSRCSTPRAPASTPRRRKPSSR